MTKEEFLCFFGTVFLILFIGLMIWKFQKEQTKQDIDRSLTIIRINTSISTANRNNDTNINLPNNVALQLQLSLYDRIELYNKKFDSNGNQTILESKHIITKTMMTKGTNDSNSSSNHFKTLDEKINTNDDEFIDIELCCNADDDKYNEGEDNLVIDINDERDQNQSICSSVVKTDSDTDTDSDFDSDSVSDTKTITKSLCLNHTQKQPMMINNNGTCVICFEEFVENDRIVWSNNSNCNHIYHKKCMVHYLATNAQRNTSSETLNVTDNPCPTCRRPNYCGLIQGEDILKLLSKGVVTTTTSCPFKAIIDIATLEEAILSATTPTNTAQ